MTDKTSEWRGMHLDIEIEDGKSIAVHFDAEVADRTITNRRLLMGLREIPAPEQILPVNPHVLALVNDGFGVGMYDNDEELRAAATRFYKRDVGDQAGIAGAEALEAALLDSNFHIQSRPSKVQIINFPNITIDPDFWDDEEENKARYEKYLSPLFKRARWHPLEQQIALIDALKEEYPTFARRFMTFFRDASDQIAARLLEGLPGEEGQPDETGTTKSGLDASSSVESIAERRNKRRVKKANSGV